MVQIPLRLELFQVLISQLLKLCAQLHLFISFSAVQIYDVSYHHLGSIANSESDQRPVGLIAKSSRSVHDIAVVLSSNPVYSCIFLGFKFTAG